MSWVSVDNDKCSGCGNCVAVCLRCFSINNKIITANAGEENCNLCGRCVAVCPQGAISHNQMDMANFLPLDPSAIPTTDSFMAFLRTRRSCRHYLKKEVPRQALQTLLEACRYSPTGSNVQAVEALIITDKDRISRLTALTVDAHQEIIARLESQAAALNAAGKELPPVLVYSLAKAEVRRRQVIALKMGRDPIFHHAPAVIVFHSPVSTSTPVDNCVIAAHTTVLTAETMGLGTCYIGMFQIVANTYQPIVDDLKLPMGNKAYSVLVVGYPKMKFFTTTDRKPLAVRWE